MGRLGLAFRVLFSSDTAKLVSELLQASTDSKSLPQPEPPAPPKPKAVRSEAVTLLSSLQRDARFVDFIQEPIDAYSDGQVGAAVREVHRGCHEVLERMFALAPIVDQPEESVVQVSDPSSGSYRLTGNVAQLNDKVTGKLVHHGWAATKCEVPKWTGDDESINVVAAAEVQIS